MTSKVVVVGVGALGSHVAQFMRSMDVDMTVIDYDVVEMKNVASQFHAKNTVRKKKVDGLQKSLNFLFGQKIKTIPHKLTVDNVEQLLRNVDLVIDCLDNFESRQVVQDWCGPSCGPGGEDSRIPCLHGALDAAGNFGRVVWSENFVIDKEPSEGAATCEDGAHLPFIVLTAAYLACSAQLYLEKNRKVGFQVHPTGAMST